LVLKRPVPGKASGPVGGLAVDPVAPPVSEVNGRQRFGILSFPVPPYKAIEKEWQWAEAVGFEQGWIPEVWAMSSRTYLEPWAILAALARATTSLRVGTLVATLVSRHPTLLAGHVLAVDQVSSGRVELGIGAGDVVEDSGLFGLQAWSAGERVERLRDHLQLLDLLLRGGAVTRTGRHYSVAGAELPEPVQRPRPPLVVAAEGKKSLGLVARYADAWVTLGGQPQTPERGVPTVSEAEGLQATKDRVATLDSLCRDSGRDPREIRRIILAYRRRVDPLSSLDAFDDFVGSYADLGFDEFVFYWPSTLATFREQREMTTQERRAAEQIAASRFSKERARSV
jgi:alkanesulfonate monooxygenase SsuD/methylene tetrahydromethanopterin reductase-like flavin-dependent oxidoreductase (luciferase family)